jgi:paraquat-inducible protein A
VLSLLLFITGIMFPLFSIKKWLFWNKDYSLITALPDMLKEQVYLLPLMVLVFVIVLPLCRFIALTLTRMIPVPPPRLVKLAYGFEKWTMWEVYALALVIVAIKLGDFTELEFRAGFWLIIAVMPLSLLDGWLFNRRMEFRLFYEC